MDADEYQRQCLRTAKGLEGEHQLLMPAIGLGGEAGETQELIKKHVYHRKPLDLNELAKELGDVLWYAAVLAHAAGLSMSTVMKMNVEKLKARYPSPGKIVPLRGKRSKPARKRRG